MVGSGWACHLRAEDLLQSIPESYVSGYGRCHDGTGLVWQIHNDSTLSQGSVRLDLPSDHPLLTTLYKLGSILLPGTTSVSLWHQATSPGHGFHGLE